MKEQKSKKRRANSSRSVFADPKQYISFFAALILIQTIFWLLFITIGTNAKTTDTMLGEMYKHHFVLTGVSGQAYTDVQNMERIESLSEIKNWPTLEYLGGSAASGYKIGVILNEKNLTK